MKKSMEKLKKKIKIQKKKKNSKKRKTFENNISMENIARWIHLFKIFGIVMVNLCYLKYTFLSTCQE
jgi:hypothetical protein